MVIILPRMVVAGVDFVMNDVYNMFAFNVSLNYEYEVTMNVSQSWGEVHQKIQEEIQEILSPLTSVVKWSHVILIVSVLLLFSRCPYDFLSARLLYLHCCSNGDTTALH